MKDSALVVVDMLYDFIDGTMACQGAEGAIEGTLRAIDKVTADTEADETGIHSTYPILFVRDHHPAGHCSFTEQGGPWPVHCVQGTHGADVHESLQAYVKEDLTFFKGEDPAQEQYSGFEGVNPAGQSLGEVLHLLEIKRVLVCGIATEYCVRNTAEDLLKDGFEVSVIQDALAWVDPNGHREALQAMEEEGIHLNRFPVKPGMTGQQAGNDRMTDIFEGLNSRQKEAVTTTEGRIRVVAGAGTGKTKALTHRYAYLVNVLGIDPANILCLTFTNKAAAEMRQRIAGMVHSGDYNDFVCTIHGFCVKFLRKEIYRLGFPKGFTVLDEEDCKAIAKDAMDEMGIKRTEKTVKQFLDAVSIDKALNGYIPAYMLPGAKITDEMRRTSRLAAYVSRQMKHYALDFDDLINVTKYILDRFPEACDWWQNTLNYIMVDEAQDCNLDDWDLVERLAAKHRNLFIVGDPDQAIYEWRGARPDLFVQFAADKTVVLDENYRSTPKILDVANCVIANNKNRIPKDLFTRKPEGRAVIHFHGKSEKEEMDWIVAQIKLLLSGGNARVNDIAVLYRSTYQSRALEQALLNARLEYTVWGGTRFFERREIKDALSYLRLVNNQDDDLAFERIVNVPSRKLGKRFLDTLRADAERDGISLFSALQIRDGYGKPAAQAFVDLIEDGKAFALEHRVSDLLNRLLDRSGLKQAIREDQDEDRLENLDELLSSIRLNESARTPDESTLTDYLQDIALYTNDDHRKDVPTLKLMTIHQAKGLEFPFVFIIGLSEGVFPNLRTIREYKKNGEEEERRLMYVAITRAEKALFLTESEGFNLSTKMNKYPSRFLAEIKREMVVVEGVIPEELWRGTRNLIHVLDEEFDPYRPIGLDDIDFSSERAGFQSPFHIGDTVTHPVFGEGVIRGANKDWTTFEVEFAGGTVRSLRAAFIKLADLPE